MESQSLKGDQSEPKLNSEVEPKVCKESEPKVEKVEERIDAITKYENDISELMNSILRSTLKNSQKLENYFKDVISMIKKSPDYFIESIQNQWRLLDLVDTIKMIFCEGYQFDLSLTNTAEDFLSTVLKTIKSLVIKEENQNSDSLKIDKLPLLDYFSDEILKWKSEFWEGIFKPDEINEKIIERKPTQFVFDLSKKGGNLIEQAIAQLKYQSEVFSYTLKKKIKNRKNHKSGRRNRENKRFKNLDTELFNEIFVKDEFKLSHEDKKKYFYNRLSPGKKKWFDNWNKRGINEPINIYELNQKTVHVNCNSNDEESSKFSQKSECESTKKDSPYQDRSHGKDLKDHSSKSDQRKDNQWKDESFEKSKKRDIKNEIKNEEDSLDWFSD